MNAMLSRSLVVRSRDRYRRSGKERQLVLALNRDGVRAPGAASIAFGSQSRDGFHLAICVRTL